MNQNQAPRASAPIRNRGLAALAAALIAGVMLSTAPTAQAGSDVRFSVSVGGPGYVTHVGHGGYGYGGYYPPHGPRYVYAPPPPPRVVYRERPRRVYCDEWGNCSRRPYGAHYAAGPGYYPAKVIVVDAPRLHRHRHGHRHGHRHHGHGHGHGHGHHHHHH
jgi:hypothetical protein